MQLYVWIYFSAVAWAITYNTRQFRQFSSSLYCVFSTFSLFFIEKQIRGKDLFRLAMMASNTSRLQPETQVIRYTTAAALPKTQKQPWPAMLMLVSIKYCFVESTQHLNFTKSLLFNLYFFYRGHLLVANVRRFSYNYIFARSALYVRAHSLNLMCVSPS